MSGGIFSPLDNLHDLDNANCHPLVCHLCYEQYEHPCLLDCYHTFCATCLRGRAADGRLSCPLCGRLSIVKGTSGLPKVDRLLKFLVDSSADNEEVVQCANCDFECKKQDADAMFYCNTCNQPLCSSCRDDTHRAKMFARHEIVTLAKRTKELHKKCPLHEEPYIMFCTEKKSMLCINCFRDMQVESRAHCIDIETAYIQGCEKLDQAVMTVKELQTSTREAIILLKAMINEVRVNVNEEESAISSLFNSMQDKLAERKKMLLKTAQNQHEEKEKAFKEQLSNMAALLPTLQVHLVTCSAFLCSANKFEFLDLGYQLMERLQKIVKLPHRLRPTQSSKINTEYRQEFARCLEPLLFLNQRRSGSVTGGVPGTGINNGNGMNLVGTKTFPISGSCASMGDVSLTNTVTCKPTSHRYISTKVLLAEGGHSPFMEHCRNYENKFRVLQTELQTLKDQVQEMHRDLTKHHSLIKTDAIEEIVQKSLRMEIQISSQYSSVETMRTMFEEVWEETYQRVANEQEIYEAQLHDLVLLKQENTYLMTIARQISPYIRSIAKVKERLEPRLKEPKEVKDDRTENMLKIYDENSSVTADGQHRNDLTCASEDKEKLTDNKDKVIDNRTLNILPGDSEVKSRELYGTAKQMGGLDSSDRMEVTS
ncbi:RING finger protein 207 isoform X2 [Scyliorhinus canicula]|nr:RING finger protein 207 isoform X2 [Scyliorhinus canicula]XP_038629636.1 RING finger protein 207 isoform X2 [Scyliorhinus canicula]XP_038629637.1 RING finger protein 207 isoform X2 [Scyliorhinus canicula]